MIPNIGPLEIAIVLIIALVVFGPKRLPELGKSAGKGLREFKGSLSETQNAFESDSDRALDKSVDDVPVVGRETSRTGEGNP